MELVHEIVEMEAELSVWRRDIHAHPELGFAENRTSDFVAQKLVEFGIQVHRGIGKTGLVGVLREGNETNSIGLRADMDALPIHEKNQFDHCSKIEGTMHACGHDGHTVMLLAAAKYLAETRNFQGQVNFIFQPAEEGLGGARAMIKDGLFEKFPCDRIYAMHNGPGLPVGKFSAVPGVRTAAGAFFDIDINALINDNYVSKRAAEVNPKTISSLKSINPGLESPNTTHYSIVDQWGNAVSNTYTINWDYGSGVVVGGAGFLLNNEMDDFSAKPVSYTHLTLPTKRIV